MEDLLQHRAAPPDRPDPRRRRSLIVLLVAFLVLVGAVVAAGRYYGDCKEAPDPDGRTVSFTVKQGASGSDVLESLHDEGLVNCAGFVGNVLLRGTGKAGEIRAGTYELTTGMTLDDIMTVLSTPPPVVPTVRFTTPEGLRIGPTYPGERSIAGEAARQLGLSAKRFAHLAESGTLSLPPYLPKGTSTAEGFLFPETYQLVKKGLDERAVIDRMLEQFLTVAKELPWDNAKALGVTPYQAVIVASMVEKEAGVNTDRKPIAGVIYNRLRIGMTLGIDATLLYDDPTPDGQLTSPDLETASPYNTRLKLGLPPTPIASPGEASLEAALEPAHTDYLYYVLCPPDGEGVHRFAKTYDEHLGNVDACLG
jgi:UPF0755 protein